MGRLDERDLDFEELFASPLPHFHQTKTLPVHQNQTITFAFPFKLILSRHSRNYRTLSLSLFLQSPPVVVGGAGVIILCFAVRFNSEPHTGAERVLPPLKPRGTTAGRSSSKGTPPAAFKRECSCFYVPASAASLPQTTPQLSFYFRCVIGR